MIIYILIIFGLATVRAVQPLTEKENYDIPSLLFGLSHIVAYVWLLKMFINS